jgi:hypothetical protein
MPDYLDERRALMKGLVIYAKSLLFHLRWLFMSEEERYAYLWARTKEVSDFGYGVRSTMVIPTSGRR